MRTTYGECGGKLVLVKFDLARAVAGQLEGKAIPTLPSLQSNDPITTYSPGAAQPRTDAVISQRNAELHSQAFGGDQAIDWVYDCIGLFSDPAGTAPWRLEKEDGTKLVKKRTKGTSPDTEEGPKDLYELLEKPNPSMLYDELMSLLVIDLLLVGNAYWFKWRTRDNGKPLALYRLAPSHVKIAPGPYGPQSYEYQPPGAKDKLKISPEQIIHFRRPNPHSAHYGLGVIQGGGRAFDLELAITDTMASYYENRAEPSLIVESERRMPRDVVNKLRMQLRSRVAGPGRAGEMLLLEAGLKANSLSTNAKDALYDTVSKMSRDRVCTKFRAFPDLIGVMDEPAGSDKVADHRREFDNATLRPFFSRLQANVTASLASAWGCKYVIDYRYQMSVEDVVKTGANLAAVPGLKVREVRQFFSPLGIEESTGDPDIDEMVLNLPGEELNATGTGADGGPGLADRGLPGEAGRPPKGSSTAAFPRDGKPLPSGAAVRSGKALVDELAQRLARVEGKALVLETEKPPRPKDSLASARTQDIDAVQAFVQRGLNEAAHTLERGLLDHVEGKASTTDLVRRVKNSQAWVTFKNMVNDVLEEGAKRAASSAVLHHSEAGFASDDGLDYEEVAKSIVHRPDGLAGIVRTFKDRIVNKLKEARATGDEASIRDAIRLTIRDWKESQAETIGDTEATLAYNEATLKVAESLGHGTVFVSDGHDHDAECAAADGQTWTIEHARQHRVEHPRCRRAFVLSPATA